MTTSQPSPTPLATRIRELRESQNMSLEELATRARISKTYLWELEKDASGVKRPSADILLRIASALGTTIANLMSFPTVRINEVDVEIPRSLQECAERLKATGKELSADDLHDLARMQFRGGQPQTANDWLSLYYVLESSRKPNP